MVYLGIRYFKFKNSELAQEIPFLNVLNQDFKRIYGHKHPNFYPNEIYHFNSTGIFVELPIDPE